eukprot:scaffold304_cov80-Skeletonema_menzelii.AAC.15
MNGSGDNSQQSAATLLSRGLLEFCNSESISTEGLHELIERHGLTPNNHNHVSNYKFFHLACHNGRITEEIIQFLLEYFPDAAGATFKGWSPLHFACYNQHVTFNIIQLLIDAAPASVRSVTNEGVMPLHMLCQNKKMDETTAMQILKLLIKKNPEAVRHANNGGDLPIHLAARGRSPEFCQELVEAYPGSERISGIRGTLPLHHACAINSLATVECLYRQYPDAINHASTDDGYYPIRAAILSTIERDNPAANAVEIVKFLLDCDPNQKLIQLHGRSLLHVACGLKYNDSNIETGIQLIKVLFDAHPEAIEDNRIASNINRSHQQVQAFINREIVYARQANDHRLMMTTDDHGQLPLHRALQNNVRLGSIKLLVKGNPSALRLLENNFALPLHIACQHHDSARVVQHLLSLDEAALDAVDRQGNTALHYACRGAKHDTISLLLENYDAASVSKRNTNDKLPIDLLWECNAISNTESVEYTGSVFKLLRAYPEMVTICNSVVSKQSVNADGTHHGKKRKFGRDQEE